MFKFIIFIGIIIYLSIKYYSLLVSTIYFLVFNNIYIVCLSFLISILYKWLKKKGHYRSNILDIIFEKNKNNNIKSNNTNVQKRNVSAQTKKIIASNQKWKCGICNNIMDYTYEIDHRIPLFKGGTNDIINLMALCRNCHGKKTILEKLTS
jgi:hypothetical protein